MSDLAKLNSEPPKGKGSGVQKPFGQPREVTPSIYSTQFRLYWTEFKQRMDWQTRGDSSQWNIELGEVPMAVGEIILFVNLWKDDKLYITLNQVYHIADEFEPLRESWRDMFNRYVRAVNATSIRVREITSSMVGAAPERKENLETGTTVYRLAAPKGEGVHPSRDGVREDETRRDGDNQSLREESKSND